MIQLPVTQKAFANRPISHRQNHPPVLQLIRRAHYGEFLLLFAFVPGVPKTCSIFGFGGAVCSGFLDIIYTEVREKAVLQRTFL